MAYVLTNKAGASRDDGAPKSRGLMADRAMTGLVSLLEAPAMRWAEDNNCRLACIVAIKVSKNGDKSNNMYSELKKNRGRYLQEETNKRASPVA